MRNDTVRNRSRAARERAGLSIGQAARLVGETADAIAQLEVDNEAYSRAPRARLASAYGVSIALLDGDGMARDYATIDSMRGAETLMPHDRDVLAEFAASLPRKAR